MLHNYNLFRLLLYKSIEKILAKYDKNLRKKRVRIIVLKISTYIFKYYRKITAINIMERM